LGKIRETRIKHEKKRAKHKMKTILTGGSPLQKVKDPLQKHHQKIHPTGKKSRKTTIFSKKWKTFCEGLPPAEITRFLK